MSDAAEVRALIERLRKIAERAGETMERIIDRGELEQVDNTWVVDEFHQAYELREVANLAAPALEAAHAEPDDDEREALARVLAITDDYDGCFERVDEWNALEQWERDAHPENESHIDREDCEFWLRRADAAMASGFRRSARVPVSRDELRQWLSSRGISSSIAYAKSLLASFDIYPKADRKPADSGEARA